MSRSQVVKSDSEKSDKFEWPQALAMTCINSTVASKKRVSRAADCSTSRRVRRSFFCVAIPTGQLFV